ncbi:hypothetical protein [Hugenholtzia roseola]|nr:hypothetical protein [Hugenholtzia roseola]
MQTHSSELKPNVESNDFLLKQNLFNPLSGGYVAFKMRKAGT